VFAAFLFSLVVIIGYQILTYPNKIVLAKDTDIQALPSGQTPAQKAGLQSGDVIVAINGRSVTNWDEITEQIVRNALTPVHMTVLRDGRRLHLVVVPELDKTTGRGMIGIQPWVAPVVGQVLPGEPAARAGFKPGDRILSADGKPVQNYVDFYRVIEDEGSQSVPVKIERGGKDLTLQLVPKIVDGYPSLGLVFQQITYKSPHYSLPVSLGKGFAKSKEGFIYFLQVMGYISVAFFIMNLIPFPALDGSHIAISTYEILARKKPNLDVVYKIQTFGFLFLIMVLIFVTFNDISSFFGK
jgi:regulator of sigma E protease